MSKTTTSKKLQYFSKTKKKWINFTNEDYLHISMLKKFGYKIRTAPKEDYKKHIAGKRKATKHIKKRDTAAKKREKKEDKKAGRKKRATPAQLKARAQFKAKITEAKRIQKSKGISYQAAVKQAFKK